MTKTAHSPLHTALIEAYRKELRHRYRLENVRRFEQFAELSDEKIEALKNFFLEHIYPPAEKRAVLDDAFDHMGSVITSPKRLKPLMGAVFKSLFKIARMFPAAIRTGTNTMEAYIETRRLETLMLEYAEANDYTPEDMDDHDNVAAMVAGLPDGEVIKFLNEIIKLFKSLSNVKLLAAARDIMARCVEVMENRTDIYEPNEIAGLQLGHAIISGGVDLFSQLEPEEFSLIIKGIETVELDWYEAILEEAANA